MKECCALTVAIDLHVLARLLGYKHIYELPEGVHAMPPRIDGGKACFDFLSDEPFEIAGVGALFIRSGEPLPHWNWDIGMKWRDGVAPRQ